LHGYPLTPGLTKEQRLEIMQKVASACKLFEGNLKGQFVEIDKVKELSEEE
jgi:hypothetical protein